VNWNKMQLNILNRTSLVEVGLIAARDPQTALDYENRLIDFKKRMEADFNVETRSSNHDKQPEKSML
jgi:hypothetical protein